MVECVCTEAASLLILQGSADPFVRVPPPSTLRDGLDDLQSECGQPSSSSARSRPAALSPTVPPLHDIVELLATCRKDELDRLDKTPAASKLLAVYRWRPALSLYQRLRGCVATGTT